MLIGLHIENVAAIEGLDLELEGGFNVLSGETGAGKSIIIDSINMVTGSRTSRDIIRNGSAFALVEALFNKDGEEIVISRKLFSDGRSVCKVNGGLSTATEIKELSAELLTIHGQHDNKLLMKQSCHRELLDKYAGTADILAEYTASYKSAVELREKIDRINQNKEENLKNLDMLKFRYRELEEADLKPGEDDELLERRDILANAEKIAEGVSASHGVLYENGGVHDMLSSAVSKLSGIAVFDERLSSVLEMLEGAEAEIDEASRELGRYLSNIESDPQELENIMERLDTISTLKRKYGGTIEEILKYKDEIGGRIEEAEIDASGTEKLEEELENLRQKVKILGKKLSEKRRVSAESLKAEIEKQLEFLDMKNVRFGVELLKCEANIHGFETVSFLISTIPGEELKPLIKIASGGELSRIMLAIQTVLTDDVETLIFDEIDTGVSGRAAVKISERLENIARGRQVICITHLAQIAPMADCHFLIEKEVTSDTAKSSVKKLTGRQRLEEIARITGGAVITELTLKNAEEMLLQAEELKSK